MEKSFPSAGEREQGGAKVIVTHLTGYAPSPPKTAAPRNFIPRLKKEQRKNLIASLLKKKHFESVYVERVGLTIRHRSRTRKKFPNTADTRPRLPWSHAFGAAPESKPSVTTAHLLLQPPLRKIVALLPLWLPNPGSPAGMIAALRPVSRHPNFLASQCTDKAGGRAWPGAHPPRGLAW